MDVIFNILGFIWNVISSEKSSSILIFFLFLIQMIIIYGCIVLLLNAKRMQIRKEKSMEMVDSALEDTNRLLIGKYYDIARPFFGEDYLEEMEVQVAEYLVRKTLEGRKHTMRRRVRKNGFDEKPPQEWITYVEHEINEDFTASEAFLTSMWPRNAHIKRDVVRNENASIQPEIKRILNELYSSFLTIANNYRMHRFFFWKIVM